MQRKSEAAHSLFILGQTHLWEKKKFWCKVLQFFTSAPQAPYPAVAPMSRLLLWLGSDYDATLGSEWETWWWLRFARGKGPHLDLLLMRTDFSSGPADTKLHSRVHSLEPKHIQWTNRECIMLNSFFIGKNVAVLTSWVHVTFFNILSMFFFFFIHH